jgi:hypothetical protein
VRVFASTLKTNESNVTVGTSFTLTWSAPGAAECTASGGGANGSPWTGSIPVSGSVNQTATLTGTFTYTLNCGGEEGVTAAPQQVVITVTAAATSSGGGGGGGALSIIDLALLAALSALRRSRAAVRN